MAWLGRLLTQWALQAQLRRFDVRFQDITQLGDAVRCGGRVVEKLHHQGQPCVRIELRSITQDRQIKIAGEALVALPPSSRT